MVKQMSSGKRAGLLALIFCAAGMTAFGALPGRHILRGHVPAAVARLTPQGDLPATNRLHLAIGLPLRNEDALNRLLQDLYNPASPSFHKFLTPEEFTARFGPTESDYAAVVEFARTNGFAITGTPRNRLLLDVEVCAADAGRAFRVTLRTYRHPKEARDFFAADTEPSVPANLPVMDIQGLSDFVRPFPKSQVMNPAMAAPRNGSAPDGSSYFGDDFRNAYVPGTALTGAGQMVGLLQFDGFYANDIATYATTAGGGRTNIVIQTVLLDGFNGVPTTGPNNGNGEVSLDIEMAMAMAPGLATIMGFEAPNNTAYFIDILNAMAASNQVKNLSCSWGGGGPNATSEGIFKTFAAQGQSFFNASGDSDAFTGAVSFPSESTNITQVGGTTLTMNGTGGSYASETVWNWGVEYGSADNGIGSSGGISTTYQIPSWQLGISMAANGGSTTLRNIPDVALTADHVFVDYTNGHSAWFGGTSCAAPLWAGFMALVNQQLATVSGSATNSVGFINPAIYEIARESIYNSVFNDIMTGNNTWASSPNAFYAVPGYDLCTGLGTPAGTNFINALVSPDPLVVVPNAGFNAVGTPAGIFNVSSQTFYLTNVGAAPLTWSLGTTSAWLGASPGGGTLVAGSGGAVVVSLNTVASNLPAGAYSAGLWFSNVTSGVAHSRLFTLAVSDPLQILPTNNFSFFGLSGGPFTPASQGIILTNAGSGVLNWSLNNTSACFNVSPVSGNLAAGAQTNVTFTPAPAATNLANGTYTAIFQVTNLASQFVQSVTGSVLVSQSLAANGGFETGDFTGWTLNGSGGSDNFVAGSASISGITPHAGSYYAALGQIGTPLGYLSQTLPTAGGQKYLLSLWLYNPTNAISGRRPPFTTNFPNEFSVAWNGGTLYDNVDFARTAWTNLQFVVAATGAATVLQIGGRDDNYYLGLDDVSVTPGFAPAITAQPTNLTILSGGSAAFSAVASGSTNLVYQWRKNGTNLANGAGIAGATTTNLTLTAVTTNSGGNYSLFVTNIFGVSTSSVANLTVVLPPAITSSSVTNRTLQCGGNTNTFTVISATGTAPLTYQWSLDGSPVLNATNTSYSVTNLHLPNHTVSVTVTNLYGSLTSNAVLTVQDTLAPVITLAGANPFYVELGSTFTDPGATATDVCAGAVSVIAGGAVNTNATGTNTLTYKAGDGGGNTNTATRTVIVRDTTPPAISWSFTNLVLAANSNCVALMINVTGTNFILATDLSGALTITQSPTNNAVLPLGTNTIVITIKDASGNAAYSTNKIIVQDQTPPAIALNGSNPLTNELGAAFTDSGVTASDACSGISSVTTNGLVNINAVGTNTLAYTAVDGSGNTNSVARTVIVTDTTPPTISWSFTNLVLAANSNCVAPMPDVIGTNYVLATDLSPPLSVSQSPTNNFILPLGTNTVVIAVADAYGNTAYSTNTVVVLDETPPMILSQPQSLTNLIGTTATFNAAAAACTPLTFQWFSNSAALAVPTGTTLTLSNLTLAAAGNYYVVASAEGGSSTSAVATLTVNLIPPAISAVAVNPDGGFNLNLAGSPGYTYVLEATPNLFPANWLPIATNTFGTNGTLPFTDTSATNYQQQFYRLRLGQ